MPPKRGTPPLSLTRISRHKKDYIHWAAVSTKNSQKQSFKTIADSPKATLDLVYDAFNEIRKGNTRVRISQAYSGVSHTFGVVHSKATNTLMVYDHNGDSLYTSDPPLQYETFLNTLATMLQSKLQFHQPDEKLLSKDKEYQYRCNELEGAGACSYYFDKYIMSRI